MVEFCNTCGTSLPKGDLTIKAGKVYTSHDYHCPSCHEIANPEKIKNEETDVVNHKDLVIKDGEIREE